jgi:hypothetical protein
MHSDDTHTTALNGYRLRLLQVVSAIRAWLTRDGLVLLWFMLLALVVIHPVLQDPRARIIGWPGDNMQHVYITGWMGHTNLTS